MSEGWEEWPLLGPGWKRRTAFRKSGKSFGQSDTYYQSPNGERFRSKPELAKFLGESVDLSCFNFKHGTLIPAQPRNPSKKKKKKAKSTSTLESVSPSTPKPPVKVEKRLSFPLQSPEEQQQNGTEEKSTVVSCNECKEWFTGVEFGRSKQSIWYCADCRASRRAFNREQKLLKSLGCGICAACSLTENCGLCSVCLLRSHNPEFGSSWKCVKRRCLKALYKPGDCGMCQGCTATEDCEACPVCLKRQRKPELEITSKCMKRICHKKKPGTRATVMSFATNKLKTKWRLMSEQDGRTLALKHKKSFSNKVKGITQKKKFKKISQRINRICGTCEACQKKLDCAKCDFCKDKPKYGGRNLKRQKCRWRQCLRFAAEKFLPAKLKSSNHPLILERLQREKLASVTIETSSKDQVGKLLPKLPIIKLERLDYKNGGYTTTDGGGWIIGKTETKPIKQEHTQEEPEQKLQEECQPGCEQEREMESEPELELVCEPAHELGFEQERELESEPEMELVCELEPGYEQELEPGCEQECEPVCEQERAQWCEQELEQQFVHEHKASKVVHLEMQDEPLDLHCPVKTEAFIDIEAADESTPVITQIFSFGSLNGKNSLDQVLQEFLLELIEIPLPAHWEVLSNAGPTLQLVQRSKTSTMAETIIHILSGLQYQIVVREYTVPSFHELYQTHPSRLTTVDEVVELICDLEAYRPCAGLPRQGPRSPNCRVLVYGGWCPECTLNSWPSGFVR